MRSCLQLALCVLAFGNALAISLNDSNSNNEQPEFELSAELKAEWNNFKSKYDKHYKDGDEEQRRLKIFTESKARVKTHNLLYKQGLSSFEMGINQFSDMTPSEFADAMGLQMPPDPSDEVHLSKKRVPVRGVKLPISIDWRKKGFTIPVKRQREPKTSSYFFSVTGALEGAHFLATENLVSLSEQQLIDCTELRTRDGMIDYIMENGGIDTDASYPYDGRKAACRFNRRTIGATCTAHVEIHPTEEALKEAVAHIGPISVAVNGLHPSFKEYKTGIYDDPTCNNTVTNHGVLVIGYGVSAMKKYWIIKNSWGHTWGIGGYMMIVRDKNNQCGIANSAMYVEI